MNLVGGVTTIILCCLMLTPMFGATVFDDTQIAAKLESEVEKSSHTFTPDGVGFKGRNDSQDFGLDFTPSAAGVTLSGAEVRFRLTAYGRSDQLVRPAVGALVATGNRIEYRRGGLIEWYVNEHRGIEQGFTIASPLAGVGPLVVDIGLEGDARPRLEGSNVILLSRSGVELLRYGGLRAWDARMNDLDARIEVHGREVRLTVQDANATYPVTIDPWVQRAKLVGSDVSIVDAEGTTVAIDGNTALVGAPDKLAWTGAVYVFVRDSSGWHEQAILTASDAAPFHYFGTSIAISGESALIGGRTGAAYVFVRSGSTWSQQAKLVGSDTSYGRSVAISGNTAVIGASGANNGAGAAVVHLRSGTAWVQEGILSAADNTQINSFGTSVAVDGDTALVRALPTSGGAGALYIFARNAGNWSKQAELALASYGCASFPIALSGDTAIAGSNQCAMSNGVAHVFVRSGNGWAEQAQLSSSDGLSDDNFGQSVSLSGDTALIGADQRALYSGVAYLFQRSGTTWIQRAEFKPTDSMTSQYFGNSVAISGGTAVVGAPGDASGGAAYVYVNATTTAKVRVSPSTASPLSTLMVTGSGFSPNETVHLDYSSANTINLGNRAADANGAFTTSLQLPPMPYGMGLIRAVGQASGLSSADNFLVKSVLIMTPNSGTPGTGVLAQGFGFGAGDKVFIDWNVPRLFMGSATADNTGSFYGSEGVMLSIPVGAALGTNLVIGYDGVAGAVGKGYLTVK